MSDSFDALSFLESAPLVPVELEAATWRVRYVGPQAERFLGFERSEWRTEGFWKRRVLPDDQRDLIESRERTVATRGSHVVDYRVEASDGRVVWVREAGTATADGEPRVHAFLVDVTDQKRQEVRLWKGEERIRGLLRNAPDAMVVTDTDGGIVEMNDQAEALFGYKLSEIVGSSVDNMVPGPLRPRLRELRRAFERDQDRRSLVESDGFAIERRDGTKVPVELSMSVVPGNASASQFFCSFRDLSPRRRVEARLRSSEQRLRAIADVVPALACVVDMKNRFRFVNEKYASWYGREPLEVVGTSVPDLVGDTYTAAMWEAVRAALSGKESRFRDTLARPGRPPRRAELLFSPQFDESGEVNGYVMVALGEVAGAVDPASASGVDG